MITKRFFSKIIKNYKQVYFVRHGITDWNKLGISQGVEADIPINKEGEEQIKKTGIYLKNYRQKDGEFDSIISSHLIRASKSASIISNILNMENHKVHSFNFISELKKGKFSGLSKNNKLVTDVNNLTQNYKNNLIDPIEKYKLELPSEICKFNSSYIYKNLENLYFETYQEYNKRCKMLKNFLKNSFHNKIIIVSHDGFMKMFFKIYFSLSTLPFGCMKNGTNCWISYCLYDKDNDNFIMVSPPNTEHLSLDCKY